MALRLVTDSTAEPVSRVEAKNHLRVDSTADDALIDGLIKSARQYAERYTRRAFVTQTWRVTMDEFPRGDVIELNRSPVVSSTGVTVKYLKKADAGTTSYTTFGSTNYQVDSESEPGRVVLKQDESWPTDVLANANAVRVDFEAGYGGSTAVPQPIKQAMLLDIGNLYENRESVIVGSINSPLKMAYDSLLWAYRVP